MPTRLALNSKAAPSSFHTPSLLQAITRAQKVIPSFLQRNIAPAWFQTTWFRVLCVVTAAFVVWAVYRLRVRQISRAINARFDERLAERTRMARELHDTFLQTIQGISVWNVNPHDYSSAQEALSSGKGLGKISLDVLKVIQKEDRTVESRRQQISCR